VTTVIVQCKTCAHYRNRCRCSAFPSGIPSDILDNKQDHRDRVDGDHGVRWQPRAKKNTPDDLDET